MSYFLWTSYGDTEVTEKTKYWVDLWEEMIDDFSKTAYDKELINPHLLLKNLYDEIKFNRLISDKNNAYFSEKLKIFAGTDEVVKFFVGADFKLLISELSQKSNRFEYLISLCEQTLKVFQAGTYFKETCNLLKRTVLDSEWKKGDEDKIFSISQNLIVELILNGYSIKTIKTIPRSLFDKYHFLKIGDEECIKTGFPHLVNAKNFYEDDKFNNISYEQAIKSEIDSLSISDRIERLKYYFDKEPFEGYGIFHIEGLKGDIDDYVGEVNFYSPQLDNYWRSRNNPQIKAKSFDEKKLEFCDEEVPYSVRPDEKVTYKEFESKIKLASSVNAAVKIKYRDPESAKRQALEIINKSLDMMRLYIESEIPFRVKLNKFYLINCEDLEQDYAAFSSENNTPYKMMKSINLKKTTFFSKENDEFLNSLKELIFNEEIKKYPLSAKLMYSLHWYRKGVETDVPEDQLLNYWIAIENLITFDSKNGNLVLVNKEERDKFDLVEGLVPYIELAISIKRLAVDTYYYLSNRIISSEIEDKWNMSGRQLKAPPDIIESCQLELDTEYKKINLEKFIQNLHLLYPYVTRKVIEKRIKFAEDFFNDSQSASKELERKLNQIKQDLLLIYRYRNLIVHNAHFDHNILPYYVMKAENLARNLLDRVLYEYIKDSKRSHQEILIWEKVRIERIIEMLKKGVPVNFWEILND